MPRCSELEGLANAGLGFTLSTVFDILKQSEKVQTLIFLEIIPARKYGLLAVVEEGNNPLLAVSCGIALFS